MIFLALLRSSLSKVSYHDLQQDEVDRRKKIYGAKNGKLDIAIYINLVSSRIALDHAS